MAYGRTEDKEKNYIRLTMEIVVQSDSRELLPSLRKTLAEAVGTIEVAAGGASIVRSKANCVSKLLSSPPSEREEND